MKLSSADKLEAISDVHEEENGSSQGRIRHNSKKDNDKSSNLPGQLNKSSNLDLHKQSNDKSEPMHEEKRCAFTKLVIYMILNCCILLFLIVHCSVYLALFGQDN